MKQPRGRGGRADAPSTRGAELRWEQGWGRAAGPGRPASICFSCCTWAASAPPGGSGALRHLEKGWFSAEPLPGGAAAPRSSQKPSLGVRGVCMGRGRWTLALPPQGSLTKKQTVKWMDCCEKTFFRVLPAWFSFPSVVV